MAYLSPDSGNMRERPPTAGGIGLYSAIAIGIGGMVGAGIFSILGVVAQAAGNGMWISFLVGGVVALLCTYSYAKLGVRFPSAGGAVEFLVQGFGDGVLSGGLNLYMWVGYVIALALYAQGFVGYALTFLPSQPPAWVPKGIGVGIVLLFTGVNLIGARTVGRAETFIVVVKLAILVLFAGAGVFFIQSHNFSPSLLPPVQGIFYGAGVLFIGYEGFGLVANTAEDMANPRKLLPQALYLSVVSVILIYLGVSLAVIGNLDVPGIVAAKDYALAQAAKPFLGDWGFKLVAVGALFSTASAINATLFGGANVSYVIARDGELPRFFDRQVWHRSSEGLLITSGLVILFILGFDLSGDSHDGQRRLPADLRQRQCGAPEGHRRHRRQKVARLALPDRLPDHAGGPELLYLPKFQAGSHYHDRLAALLLCPGVGLSNQDRQDHQTENLIRWRTRRVLPAHGLIRKPRVTLRRSARITLPAASGEALHNTL